MSQLKIGLFNESFPPIIDGVSNVVVNYARVVHEKHGESVVVTPRYKNVTDNYPFKVIRYTSLPTERTCISYRTDIPFSVPLIRQIQKENLNIIHVHSPFTAALLARNVNIGHKVPVIMTYHTKFSTEFEYTLKKKVLCKVAAEFVTNNFNYADEVWTVSKGAADSLRELGYEGETRVMVNGSDITLDPVSPEIMRRVQAETAIASSELVFMYCGRMQWYKNIKLIIDALVKVKAAGVRFKMIFVGNGPEPGQQRPQGGAFHLDDVSWSDSRQRTPQGLFHPRRSVPVPVNFRYRRTVRDGSGGLPHAQRAGQGQLCFRNRHRRAQRLYLGRKSRRVCREDSGRGA